MVVLGKNKIRYNSGSSHCWKHSMFNSISSTNCNTTLIPTIKDNGISQCNFCGFLPWILDEVLFKRMFDSSMGLKEEALITLLFCLFRSLRPR